MKEGKKLTIILVLLVLMIPVFLYLTHDQGIDENSIEYKLYEYSKDKGYDKDYKKWEKAVEDGSLKYRIINGEVQWDFSGAWVKLFTEEPEWMEDFTKSDLYSNYYVVDFETNSETQTLSDVEIKEGDKVVKPTLNPENDMVAVWYTEDTFETLYNFNATVTTSFTLYADWVIDDGSTDGDDDNDGDDVLTTYNITYNLDGGDNGANQSTYTEEDSFRFEAASKTGYTFHGWYTEDTFENTIEEIVAGTTGDMTLYAKFVANEYTITFNVNGGDSLDNETLNVTYDADFVLPTPTKNYNNFIGWYYDNGGDETKLENGIYTIADSVTLVAKWEEFTSYNIYYELNGGENESTNPTSYEVAVGVSSINLKGATKDDFVFDGWYLEADFSGVKVEEILAGTKGDITLYAKFVGLPVSFNFDSGNGTLVSVDGMDGTTLTINLGDHVTFPTATQTGFTFVGWYYLSNGTTGTKIFLQDGVWTQKLNSMLTVTAEWSLAQYTIDYNLGEGETTTNPTEFNKETETITLTDGVKTGHVFDGWYDNANFTGEKITEIAQGTTQNIVLYPKFTAAVYEITFNVNQGVGIDPLNVTYNTEYTLPTPLRTDYTFTGWTYEGVAFTSGTYTLTESITIAATWKQGNFDTYGNEYTSDGDDLILSTGATDATEMILPSEVNGRTVIRVAGQAFLDNTTIESITFADSIVSVGYQAFKGCTSLASVIFAEDGELNKLFSESFSGCTALLEITIPSTVIVIEPATFSGRSGVVLTVNVEFTESEGIPSTWSFPDGTIFNYAAE